MSDKKSYWDGYDGGNRTHDGSPYDWGAVQKQKELEEQKRKEQEERNEATKKFWNELGNNTVTDNTDSGYSGTSGILIVGIILAAFFWYLSKDTGSSSYYPPVYSHSKLDEISDPPAGPGFVNIAEHILIYPSNKESTIGKFKYGIPEDSIKWFLARANIDKAPKAMSWASKKMVYLKNIPPHWVIMTNGSKLVNKGWFSVYMFHNYVKVNEEAYRRIRAANGL